MFLLAGSAIALILITSINTGIFTINTELKSQANAIQITKNTDNFQSENSDSKVLTPTITKPSPTVEPTVTPTSKPTDIPTLTPEPATIEVSNVSNTTNSSNIGLNLMNQINEFRSGKGLAPLSTDGYTCAFATLRAQEISNSFNHDGFNQRINDKSLPYPSYSSIAENIAMNSDPNQVVQKWIESSGHNENMSKNVPYGCVGTNGNYYSFEAWAP